VKEDPVALTQPQDAAAGTVVVELSRAALLKGVLKAALTLELVFFALDATLNHAGILHTHALQRLFNTTREDALASWFGVTQTFCVGLVAVWATLVERARRSPGGVVAGWTLVAACFLYLAMDDGSTFHERFGTWFTQRSQRGGSTWFPSYGWQVLFAPVFGSMGLFLLGFLWRQLADGTARRAVLGSIAMLGTAVVLDFVEGLDETSASNPYVVVGKVPPVDQLAHAWFGESGYEMILHFSKSTEECTEMAAMTIMLWVLLRHVTARAPAQRWTFG
jgi:hypothetical protein